LGEKARPAGESLRKALEDPAPDVQIAAADALCRIGRIEEALAVLVRALKHENEWARLRAANVLDGLGPKALPVEAELRAAAKDRNNYVQRVIEHALMR
jgi:HEAT repeat protein